MTALVTGKLLLNELLASAVVNTRTWTSIGVTLGAGILLILLILIGTSDVARSFYPESYFREKFKGYDITLADISSTVPVLSAKDRLESVAEKEEPVFRTSTVPEHLLRENEIPEHIVKQKIPFAQKLPVDFSAYHVDRSKAAAQYHISPKPCSAYPDPIFLLIIAVTRVEGFALRKAVRTTWGSLADPKCGVRLVFIAARTRNADTQLQLQREAGQYGDIIQSNMFDDNYRAQAQKAIHLFQWAAGFCPNTTFTAKIDDDNWLNIEKYVAFLRVNVESVGAIGGMFWAGGDALRDPDNKYYVPREDYMQNKYPEYLTGMLYAYPTKVLSKLIHFAKRLNAGLNEDMFMNGLVASAAGLHRIPVPNYGWGQDAKAPCQKKDYMCVHYSREKEMYKMWNDTCYTYGKLCS